MTYFMKFLQGELQIRNCFNVFYIMGSEIVYFTKFFATFKSVACLEILWSGSKDDYLVIAKPSFLALGRLLDFQAVNGAL